MLNKENEKRRNKSLRKFYKMSNPVFMDVAVQLLFKKLNDEKHFS